MKVVLVTPEYHQTRGNTVTVRRMSKYLQKSRIETTIVSLTDGQSYDPPLAATIVHGFNAYRFGKYWYQVGRPSLPYVVTITGTDLNHDLFDDEKRQCMIQTLDGAEAIHLFNHRGQETLLRQFPRLAGKTVVIPQGVSVLPRSVPPIAKEAGTCVFLLPAGIRKVKNVPAAISMLDSVHRKHAGIRLWIVGPVIEEEEGKRVRELIRQNSSWVTYLGEVSFDRMGGLYRQADVVLNTSYSEGQSSAILEALAHGVPVLAADNEGNRDVIKHGQTGWLYQNRETFLRYAGRLVTDALLRERFSRQGQQYVTRHHCPETEAEKLLHMYTSIMRKWQ